jgi:hypothetical protein
MKLVSFEFFSERAPRPGLLLDDAILDLTPLGVPDTTSAIAVGTTALRQAMEMPGTSLISLSAVHLLAPIPRPSRIFCRVEDGDPEGSHHFSQAPFGRHRTERAGAHSRAHPTA